MTDPSFTYLSRTRAFYLSRMGPFGLIVWTTRPVSDGEFVEHCEAAIQMKTLHGPALVFLNYALDFAASTKQRSILKTYEERMGLGQLERLAIISESIFVRGVFAALSWFISGLRSTKMFPATEINQAFAWLNELHAFDEMLARRELAHGTELIHGQDVRAQIP